MSLHILTAGSGYDYLTRQVAALDSTEKGHTSLASYYSERGEQPGVPLWSYAHQWVAERPGLSERSVRFYEGLLRLHIVPVLGGLDLRTITPATVWSWRQGLLDRGVGESTVSKPYRLLRAVLNTAADDELIRRNPCRIKGAGVEHPAERPVLTLNEVMRLSETIDPRYRLLVLLAVFASLRWGELMGLRKSDFDLDEGLVRIERSISEVGARQVVKRPKTAAGIRAVAVPVWLVPLIRQHFCDYSEREPDGRVFVGPYGATPGRANFSGIWARAIAGAELSGFHVHDLRHTGNHLAAISGASTRELMGRMGHVSVEAALVYQHRTASRDRAIADALDLMVRTWAGAEAEISGHVGGTPPG